MITYLKLTEMFGIPEHVSKKVAATLANLEENFDRAINIEEFDEIMNDVGKLIVEMSNNADFKDVCMAINLYAFYLALERKMRELGIEEIKDALSNTLKLRDLILDIKFPNVPVYHHPLVKTFWLNIEPVIMLNFVEIVKNMAREIWGKL